MVEAASEKSAPLYSSASQQSIEGVLVLDETGTITYANETAEVILGYRPGELIGYHCHDIWSPTLYIPAISKRLETLVCRRNGRLIPAALTITPVAPNSSYQIVHFLNLADAKQRDQALVHTQRLAGIGTLTASIAHELTNPMSIITATCHAILQEVKDNTLSTDDLVHYTRMIERSAWRCVRLTEALRSYTHQGDAQRAITNLNALIDDALMLVQQQFRKEFNVQIQTDLDPNPRSIVCDHHRMTQVLVNLLTNARDAMQPMGGTITIKSWFILSEELVELDPKFNIAEAAPGNETMGAFAFSVSDTGYGIKPDIIEYIFDPFFTTKRSNSGTGLGLYIAKGIIDQHNGRIWAENLPEGGAKFTILLPQQ